MPGSVPVEDHANSPARTSSRGIKKLRAAVVALHSLDGHIHLEFPAEESIDLETPRPNGLSKSSLDSPRQLQDSAESEAEALDLVPPLMSICIMIVGTRGDVQPFLAIAHRLQQDGHRVRLATHAVYREFVMSHGVEFYPLGGDPKELAAYMVKTGGHLIPTKIETLTKDVPRNREMINEILLSTWPAVSDADPEGGGPGVPGPPFRAQAVISNPVTYGHIHVAERLGVPLHIMFPQPWVPTMAFPHPLSNLPYTGKWQKRNYLSYKIVDLLMWQGTEGLINEFRTEVLKLRKIRSGDFGPELLLDLEIPHSFMWSPKLVSKPADWGDLYDVIGTVTLKETASVYSPSPELEAFLGNDGGPIFVGFGSMVLADPLATTKMIIEAAKQANVRVLIQSSWSDMAGDLDIPSNVFFLGNCPHDWLMPRVSAVVHHGGAGTTAAGLLAGKPTFIVPFFGDQPFWGQAVMSARVGVSPCPIGQLTTDILRKAFVDLANSDLRARALKLRDIMQQEDGAGEAVRSFYRHLPTQDMWCDLDHERIATLWSIHDKIKLCDRCAFIVTARQENRRKKLLHYNCIDYSARGPSSLLAGVGTGTAVLLHELTGAFTGVLAEPVKGLVKGGIVGGVKGTVAGVYYLIVRPVHGAVLLVDHIAVGHKNANREEGHRKEASVFDRQLMAALGEENGRAGTFCLEVVANSVDHVLFIRKKDRQKMLNQLRYFQKRGYRARYEEHLRARKNEKLAAKKREGYFFSSGDESQHAHDQSLTTPVQQFLNEASGDMHGDADNTSYTTALSGLNASESREPSLSLRSTRLSENGTVEMVLDIPSESADVINFATAAQWEKYHRTKILPPETKIPLPIPPMNVCLAAIGTWNNGVKQFVAIGMKLRELGHRVRLAANERFRSEITARGLGFYPLAGAPESIQDFAKFLHDCQNAAHTAVPGRLGSGAIQSFKELIYSLWPAAYGSDPHGGGMNVPGHHFRADSLLWHPLLLGHVHVAERLGIPLQCASLDPLSPTFTFPHPLCSIPGLEPSVMTLCKSNLMSYGVVDTTIWYGAIAQVLAQFRVFIGLEERCIRPDPLVRWGIPHIYLWNPALLPKPLDWGTELPVVGHVTLSDGAGLSKKQRKKREKESKRFRWPDSLIKFAFQSATPPVIYFGVSTRTMTTGELSELLQKLDLASSDPKHEVRIIFQTREVSDEKRKPHKSTNVFEIDSSIPYARLFQKVAAVIHWGEPDVLAEALAAGKPVGTCGIHSSQQFWASVCEQAQVGLPLINWRKCTVDSLTSSFLELLKPGLGVNAQKVATTFDPEKAINAAVNAFTANLPMEAMRCDVDRANLARVFDTCHDLKLSLEAYLAVQPRRDESKGFVPYKPLRFGGSRPPRFSISGNPGETPPDSKPARLLDGVALTMDVLDLQASERISTCTSSSASDTGSINAHPSNIALYWASAEEEVAVRTTTNAAYERLVKRPKRTSKLDTVKRMFGVGKQARRREELQYLTVQ